MNDPLVSILVVARNTGSYIGAAIASARAQTFADIEIVVVDDASTDDTRAIAERHAAEDPRVRVLDGPQAGLAAVRNASLAAARGRYAAILDSDDLLHPEHVARLVAAARASNAEMIVANMVEFGDAGLGDGTRRVRLFAEGRDWQQARPIRADEYVRSNTIGADVVLGYLKPLFDLAFLKRHGLEYDRRLRIGEDFDLVFRAMLAGGRLHFIPEPGYFYRKHEHSTSARTPAADLEAQLASSRAYSPPADYAVLLALAKRQRAIASSLRSTGAIAGIKQRRLLAAGLALGTDRHAWRELARSLREAVTKRLHRRRRPGAPVRIALVLGAASAGPALKACLDGLAKAGVEPVRIEPQGRPERLADALPEPEVVVLTEPEALALLPFAIAPAARVLGADGGIVAAGVAA